jgi:hypothetical protein
MTLSEKTAALLDGVGEFVGEQAMPGTARPVLQLSSGLRDADVSALPG